MKIQKKRSKLALYLKRIRKGLANFIKKTLSSKLRIGILFLSIVVFGASFYAANFVANLSYDFHLSEVISKNQLQLLLALPFCLIYLNIIILIRVIIQWINKKPGSGIRFRFLSFSFIVYTASTLLFILIFYQTYGITFNSFNNQLLLKKMRIDLEQYRSEIKKEIQLVDAELREIVNKQDDFFLETILQSKVSYDKSHIDSFYFYDHDGKLTSLVNKKHPAEQTPASDKPQVAKQAPALEKKINPQLLNQTITNRMQISTVLPFEPDLILEGLILLDGPSNNEGLPSLLQLPNFTSSPQAVLPPQVKTNRSIDTPTNSFEATNDSSIANSPNQLPLQTERGEKNSKEEEKPIPLTKLGVEETSNNAISSNDISSERSSIFNPATAPLKNPFQMPPMRLVMRQLSSQVIPKQKGLSIVYQS